MDIILWRHAEAEMQAASGGDLARALTGRGEQQALAMAAWLNARLPHGTSVLASPAKRTQQTAAALGRPVQTLDAMAPGAAPEALLDAIDAAGPVAAVLLVGHQPTLGETAALLLCGRPLPWSVKKAGVWWFRRRDARADTVLLAVTSPDEPSR